MSNDLEIIDADDSLYRRLHRKSHLRKDGTVNSSAFKRYGKPTYDDQISVDLARLTTPKESVNRSEKKCVGFCLGVCIAHHPLALGFSVVHDPEEGNYSHSLIKDQNNTQGKSRKLSTFSHHNARY